MEQWGEKRYHALDYMLKQKFGEKVYRLSLNGGMTCPNRDGTLGTSGCIFCSAGGSGDFAAAPAGSVTAQSPAAVNSSPIFRPTPTLMPRSNDCGRCSLKP